LKNSDKKFNKLFKLYITMFKLAVIALIVATCVFESTAIRCYVGYSAPDLPLAISVRDIECGKQFDHCTTIKYTLGGQAVIQGNCARKYGQAMCQFMRNPHKTMTDCSETLCQGDYCNTAVYESEQAERKKVGPFANTLQCYTGLLTEFPDIPFASADVPLGVDACFPGSEECVTMTYNYIYKFETQVATKDNIFKLPVIQKMCNRPKVNCDNWCSMIGKNQAMENCKTTCCKGNYCNA